MFSLWEEELSKGAKIAITLMILYLVMIELSNVLERRLALHKRALEEAKAAAMRLDR